MTFSVQEQPLTAAELAQRSIGAGSVFDPEPPLALPLSAGDAISSFGREPQTTQRFMQDANQSPFGSLFGLIPGGNLLQAIFEMLQQLLSAQHQSGGFGFNDNERYFQNATGASVGDPHLSFNGQTWDNMGSQPDLLHSDSFSGGFQLSTQTTPPAANGVTYNQSATVTTNGGATTVTMDKDGNVSIAQYGNAFTLQPGQSIDLDNGQFVQRNQNGSLQITCNNGTGGTIITTMTPTAPGLNITTTANNVNLGGTLVNNNNQPTQPPPPHWQPQLPHPHR